MYVSYNIIEFSVGGFYYKQTDKPTDQPTDGHIHRGASLPLMVPKVHERG